MPTYEYRCVSCEHQFERFQRMTDEPVKECEVCGEPVKRLLFPVAIHFKGNGFYSTDYAKRNTLSSSGNGSNGGSGESAADSSSSAPSSSTSEASGSSDTASSKTSSSKPEGSSKSPVGASSTKND